MIKNDLLSYYPPKTFNKRLNIYLDFTLQNYAL